MPIAGFDLRVVPLLWAITALLLLGAALLLWPNIPWGRLRRFWQRAPRLIGGVSGLACLIGGWWLIQALQLVELAAALRWVVALLPALLRGAHQRRAALVSACIAARATSRASCSNHAGRADPPARAGQRAGGRGNRHIATT
jgi:hypothetical protein